MPYELGTIWNVTSKYIYNTLDKNIGIGTTTPICELDVYCNIAENGIKLEDKYQLKPEHNKKYDLIVREDLDEDNSELIIWYKFNKEDFTSNFTSNLFSPNDEEHYGNLITIGTGSNLQKEYYVGTGSAEINVELYYKIEMSANQFIAEKCTFCFWLFLNEECENDRYILNLQDYDDSAIFYFKYTTDKLIIYKNQDDYIEYYRSLDKNKWHHITIIINDTASTLQKQRTLLIDGIPINSNPTGTTISTVLRGGSTGTADIYLGNTSDSINGYIDDFRIYESNLPIEYIRTNIIGKITKITPGNISANGNYGIDIVNYSSNVNIGTENSKVDLTIYGDLTVTSNFNIDSITIDSATFLQITSDDITATSITENDKRLIDKYALIGSIDKNTDIIVSKMIDSDDVDALYGEMPAYFQSNLIISYNFDYDFDNINNSNEFFRNRSYDETSGWYTYDVIPNKEQFNIIDYYGTKYVKGNASLHCYSNVDGIHYYNFSTKEANQETFHRGKNYTISFWIRFNKIGRIQHIFHFGSGYNQISLKLNDNNKLVFINTGDSNEITGDSNEIIVNDVSFKKDEWYHICIILKNKSTIYVTKSDFQGSDYDDLIDRFTALGYSINSSEPDIIQFDNNDYDGSGLQRPSLFIYINGIKYKNHTYDQNKQFFGNEIATNNFIGVENSELTTNYLDGFIDDFKIYETIVPIHYINKHIIGDALVIKPGQLSAIGNYGINIENFNNVVSIGQQNTNVNLNIYGLLNVVNDTITFSNIQIDAIENALSTSNITITNILNTNSNISSNITVSNSIEGNGFILGSSCNLIDDITITTLSNINLTSSNITADTITVNNELILKNAILSNINVIGINIDDTFSISNNDITILSNLIIGDNSFNDRRYDLANVNIPTSDALNTHSSFDSYNSAYIFPSDFVLTTIRNTNTNTNNIQVFDNSIIFYGNTGTENYDIHFKNNYIRNNDCNIKEEIDKSYFGGLDRDRTRIKLDVGNIKLQNGFIELKHKNILDDYELSTLKIEENQISITNNANTTILNNSLMLSNTDNHYCVLTNSNFTFNSGYGFINNETLKIKTIEIEDEIGIDKINTLNSNPDIISINTSNANNPYGKIQGFLCSNSKIDILNEIITDSNIICEELNTKIANVSNIICEYEIGFTPDSTSNTTITKDRIEVNTLQIYGSIILGHQASSGNDNSIDGDFGSLSIKTINTTNPDSNALSIDTFYETNLGKIRGLLSSNSKINIDDEIRTNSNIYCVDLESSNIYVSNLKSSNINVINLYSSNINTSNITVEDQLNVYNIIATDINVNDLYSSNINVGNITVENELNVHNIIASNIYCSDTIESSNIINSNITVNNTLYVNDIEVSNIDCSDTIESSNIISSNVTVNNTLSVNNIAVSDTVRAVNIRGYNTGYTTEHCEILGILSGDSYIDINGEIKTTSNIYASNIITDTLEICNILNNNSDSGYFIISSNSGILINNIKTTSLVNYSIDTLVDGSLGKIRGKLADNSEIHIDGRIKTTSNISGNILEINTIIGSTGSTGSTGININNDINFNCNITNDVTIDDKKFQIITHIPGIAEPSPQIELIDNCIKSFGDIEADRHIYMEFDYNGLRRVDGNTCNIISYDEGINGIILKCKKLEVENFDPGDGSQFKFPNIISFSRNTTASIPNVYIGYNTDNTNINTDKDVLYIDTDTGNDKRLNVGNILVRNNIEISHNRDATDSKLLRITTMETVESSRTAQYAFFINQNDNEMLTIDLDSGSIGINTRPLASDDQIKLFVNGGIKSSGDIIGFANVSDKRFKTDIRSFDINDIEIVNKLNPVKFRWKEDLFNSNMANKNDIGFIAQEVKLLIPEAVSTFKIEMNDIDYNYIKYERMIPYLINNIKYLNNKIVELENKLNGI